MIVCSCRNISDHDYFTEKELKRRLLQDDYKCRKCIQDMAVESPCIKVCTPDENNEYCVGCYRTLDEIREWFILSDVQKFDILEKIKKRKNETVF